MTPQSQAEAIATHRYLSFRLDKNLFAVEVTKVREILDLTPIVKVPQTPDHMLGVINLRGHVVPVVDLRLKFGLPATEASRDSCIIVMEVVQDKEFLTIGALSDGVEEVLDLSPDQIDPPPRLGNGVNTRFIQGMGKTDEQFLILLDIDRVFSGGENTLLKAFEEGRGLN